METTRQKQDESVLLRRMYAEGLTPSFVRAAFTRAREATNEEWKQGVRALHPGVPDEELFTPQDDWGLCPGIRKRFAEELGGRELTQQVHYYFDWACAQWQGG